MEPLLLRTLDVALKLNLSVEEVRRWVRDGRLQSTGKGRGLRILARSLTPYLNIEPDIDPSGHIYLIRFDQYFKIGYAKDVRKRMWAMNVSFPRDLILVHTFPSNNPPRAESILHERYKDFRVRGEWFLLSEDHVSQICECKAMNF